MIDAKSEKDFVQDVRMRTGETNIPSRSAMLARACIFSNMAFSARGSSFGGEKRGATRLNATLKKRKSW
jgi:hypothetical protein